MVSAASVMPLGAVERWESARITWARSSSDACRSTFARIAAKGRKEKVKVGFKKGKDEL